MTDSQDRAAAARALEIPLDRDVFTRTLIRELAGALEDVVGLSEPPAISASSDRPSVSKSIRITAEPTRSHPCHASRSPTCWSI
jgi:hypothetical protein